ncbi:MAG: hypothetical protein P4L40_04180 [Terracidiphilus sp.]|nr:hypothetical protein [Terracidiphilus sp.]
MCICVCVCVRSWGVGCMCVCVCVCVCVREGVLEAEMARRSTVIMLQKAEEVAAARAARAA